MVFYCSKKNTRTPGIWRGLVLAAAVAALALTVVCGFLPKSVYAGAEDGLHLSSSSPANGATEVDLNPSCELRFDHNVAAYELRENNLASIWAENEDGEVLSNANMEVSFSDMFVDRQKVYIKFNNLQYETTYYIHVDPLFKCNNGAALDENAVTISFKTLKKPPEEVPTEDPGESEVPPADGGEPGTGDGGGDVYIDDGRGTDSPGDDETVIARDGGKESGLGSDGDDAAGSNPSKSKTSKKAAGPADRGDSGGGPSGNTGQQSGTGRSTSAAGAGNAQQTGTLRASAADNGNVSINSTLPTREEPEIPETPEESPETNKQKTPEQGHKMPHFNPLQTDAVKYIALAAEILVIALALAGGMLQKRGQRAWRKQEQNG